MIYLGLYIIGIISFVILAGYHDMFNDIDLAMIFSIIWPLVLIVCTIRVIFELLHEYGDNLRKKKIAKQKQIEYNKSILLKDININNRSY